MIIARYLARDILLTTFVFTLVLLLIVLSGRLSSYIADAATGRLAADLVFPILLARIPEYLELVLPLSLFLGVLIALGQQQENNELVVMQAGGIGPGRMLSITLTCAFFVALIIALFSFFVSPRGGLYVNELIASQGLQSEMSNVTPGRFYPLESPGRSLYTTELSEDRSTMLDVFVSPTEQDEQAVTLATRGFQQYGDNGGFYFVLEEGHRYEGSPGRADFRVSEFGSYAQLLENPEPQNTKLTEIETLFLPELFGNQTDEGRAELGWRLSLPLMVLMLGLLAQPLSRSAPRQGRFMKLIPAIGLYMIYYVSLNALRDKVQEGAESGLLMFAGLHLSFLVLGIIMLAYPSLRLRMRASV